MNLDALSALRVSGGLQCDEISIQVSGFKHAAIPIICASIILNRDLILENCPKVLDIDIFSEILRESGGIVNFSGRSLILDSHLLRPSYPSKELTNAVHGTQYLFLAFLLRFEEARFGTSGGCSLDKRYAKGRPTEHLAAILGEFGYAFEESETFFYGRRSTHLDRNVVIDIRDYSDRSDVVTGPQVSGATKFAILCSLTNTQSTTILHPYYKPDVLELLEYLEMSGFSVQSSRNRIDIRRTDFEKFLPKFQLVSCPSEVMTFVALAVMSAKPLRIHQIVKMDRLRAGLDAEFRCLDGMNLIPEIINEDLILTPPYRLKSLDIEVTSQSIYSDHQPFFALMLSKVEAQQTSSITEKVWKDRFSYADEMNKLGLNMRQAEGSLSVTSSTFDRCPPRIEAQDLRGAAALLLAIICNPLLTETCLHGWHHLVRGYDGLVDKLEGLGVTFSQMG